MSDGTGAASRIPDDFCVELSSGGGFTGAWQGRRVAADGKVYRWRTGPNAGGKREEAIGSIDRAAVERLLNAVEATRFFHVSLDQPGNMTVVLRVVVNGREHAVRYPLPAGPAPEPVRPLVETFEGVVRPVDGRHDGSR